MLNIWHARPLAGLRGGIAETYSAAAVTGALIILGLTLLLFATEFLPSDATRRNLQHSFDSGALRDEDWPGKDRIRGANQYNDCLLVMMTRLRTSPASSAVAPVVIFSDYPVDLKTTECAIARRVLFFDAPRQLYDAKVLLPYGRYVHAYRIPFNTLIAFFQVDFIRQLYRLLAVAILAAAMLLHLKALIASTKAGHLRAAAASGGFLTIALGLAAFSGIDLFSQSLTHGPSDILLFAAFAALSLGPRQNGLRRTVIVAALGSLAFAFDFFHGTLPMMLAIILGCSALRAFADAERLPALASANLASIFLVGVIASVAAKLFTLGVTLGTEGIRGFYRQLRFRINGGEYSLTDIVWSLKAAMPNIAFNQGTLAIAALMGALTCAAAALCIMSLRKFPPSERGAVLMALASIAVIFCWYIVFRNHSALHGYFMVRILAWPIAMGPACLILAGAAWLDAFHLRSGRTEQLGQPVGGSGCRTLPIDHVSRSS